MNFKFYFSIIFCILFAPSLGHKCYHCARVDNAPDGFNHDTCGDFSGAARMDCGDASCARITQTYNYEFNGDVISYTEELHGCSTVIDTFLHEDDVCSGHKNQCFKHKDVSINDHFTAKYTDIEICCCDSNL